MSQPIDVPPTVQTTCPEAPLMWGHCGAPWPVRDGMIYCARCKRVFKVPTAPLVKVGRISEGK